MSVEDVAIPDVVPIIPTAPKLKRGKPKASQEVVTGGGSGQGDASEGGEATAKQFRILCTGNDSLDKKIEGLGGVVVHNANEATHLVAPRVRVCIVYCQRDGVGLPLCQLVVFPCPGDANT